MKPIGVIEGSGTTPFGDGEIYGCFHLPCVTITATPRLTNALAIAALHRLVSMETGGF